MSLSSLLLLLGIAESVLLYFVLVVAAIGFTLPLKQWKKALQQLGVVPKKISEFSISRTFKEAVFLLVLVFFLLTFEALLLSVAHVNDAEKVAGVIQKLSVIAMLVAVTIAPFAEEVFFRGFLQKKVGVILTALLFSALHFSFGSTTELVGAFTAALVFGWWVKYKNPSLWPVILAHAGYNAISVLLVVGTGMN